MNYEVVKTVSEKCAQCYSCVRNCPVKAVRINNGRAQVIQERCIQCGNCVTMCSRQAKEIADGIHPTLEMINKGNAIAIVAPSFPAVYKENHDRVVAGLKKLGFSQVWEVALGAELVAKTYRQLDFNNGCYISSACPAVINLVQKHYPHLIPHLVPVVSPAIATGRLIRQLFADQDVSIVFIGPCIAKKGEIRDPEVSDAIDEVLTFDELNTLLESRSIDLGSLDSLPFDVLNASLAYLFPLSGGLLKNLGRQSDLLQDNYMVVDGSSQIKEIFNSLDDYKENINLIDCLFCSGCINGPAAGGGGNILEKKRQIINYMNSIPKDKQNRAKEALQNVQLDLKRSFTYNGLRLPVPREENIKKVLAEIGKNKEEDLLDCGACGYSSCREKAIAVCQGIAEKEMCMPFLLSQKIYLLSVLEDELAKIRELKEELDIIIDSSYDGICLTDSNGKVLRINDAFARMLQLKPEEVIGSSTQELERSGVARPSVSMMALKSGKPVTFLQRLKSGKQVLATGTPVFDEDGNITKVIANIRNFEELQRIRKRLDEVKYSNGQTHDNMDDGDAHTKIIAFSEAFGEVLDIANRIANVDSTVLVLGESGVGKEVIVRYIHRISNRAKGPFIKINCGALPESLIESELFGYDTGAFTGAKKQGKPGLFELADKGILFLDEIGELPLSQQVKLLQAIQEKRIVRVGGTKPIPIDVRIIVATNRDLAKMVKNGEFRADLYYRLNVVPITVPPLRKRRDDIIPLARHFLKVYNTKYSTNKSISREVRERFLEYNWPGNVRELRNIMERLVVTAAGDIITQEDLPPALKAPADKRAGSEKEITLLPLKKALEEREKELILQARQLYNSTYKMAEVLEVNQSTIVRKLKKYSNKDK
ncbi:MAG TPA: sigma 54-interacting transcriptional regulator [Clostridiales bacterium]|nr:sigma 54-interacting transcriptional regulator [Clostridiales bacterium]